MLRRSCIEFDQYMAGAGMARLWIGRRFRRRPCGRDGIYAIAHSQGLPAALIMHEWTYRGRQLLYVISREGEIFATDDKTEWMHCMNDFGRRKVGDVEANGVRVATHFTGMDQARDGVPLLFETQIFGGDHSGLRGLAATWADAQKIHEQVCKVLGIKQQQGQAE